MARGSGAPSFTEYLEAKFAVDEASLAPGVLASFRNRMAGIRSPHVLDVGTGTGAMLRRLAAMDLHGEAVLVGLDSDAGTLESGSVALARALRRDRWKVKARARAEAVAELGCRRKARRLEIALVRGDLMDAEPAGLTRQGGFDAVTAHAILDLLPPGEALTRLRGILRPHGLLYTTLNYDGMTTLLPERRDGGFESRLLRAYDRSMEARRWRGRKTAGARSGRRIHDALVREGWRIEAAGASDWAVFPVDGAHSADRQVFLRAMLGFVLGEGLRSSGIGRRELERWKGERLADVEGGRLGLVVHQLDFLASSG